MDRLPNWLRYILAIPYGIVLVIFVGFIIYISNLFFSDSNSLYTYIITFVYRNGINVIILFYGINNMLPNYKFKITLIISIIIGMIYSILQGMSIILGNLSIEYIIAYIELIFALILSCYFSFTKKFEF